jgi:hypothetical protein
MSKLNIHGGRIDKYFIHFESEDIKTALDEAEKWCNNKEHDSYEVTILQISTTSIDNRYILTLMYKLKVSKWV